MSKRRRRGIRGFNITSLPYEVKVYMNNQVLIPAQLVRSLGIQGAERARVTLEFKGERATVEVKLLRTKYTDSRQFTIPKEVRLRLGLKPGDIIKVLKIERI